MTTPTPGPRSGALTWNFIAFGLLISISLLSAFPAGDVAMQKAGNTGIASMLLAIPALTLFFAGPRTAAEFTSWRWSWTFSWLAYALHFYYAFFGVFGRPRLSVAEALEVTVQFQDWVAYTNLAVTIWWTLDVLFAWLFKNDSRFLHIQRLVLHWFVAISFIAATLVFRPELMSKALGAIMAVACILGLVVALLRRRASPHGAEVAIP